jgi:hypothetical protein
MARSKLRVYFGYLIYREYTITIEILFLSVLNINIFYISSYIKLYFLLQLSICPDSLAEPLCVGVSLPLGTGDVFAEAKAVPTAGYRQRQHVGNACALRLRNENRAERIVEICTPMICDDSDDREYTYQKPPAALSRKAAGG